MKQKKSKQRISTISVDEALSKIKGSSVKFPGLEVERVSAEERRKRGRTL